MKDASTRPVCSRHIVAEASAVAMPRVPDELHVEVIHVLANMAMATHQEQYL